MWSKFQSEPFFLLLFLRIVCGNRNMDGIYYCFIFLSLGLQMRSVSFRNADNNVHWQWHEQHHQFTSNIGGSISIWNRTNGNNTTTSSANKLLNIIVKCHAGATAFATTLNSTMRVCCGKMGNKQIVNVKICIFLVYFSLSLPSLFQTAFFCVGNAHVGVFMAYDKHPSNCFGMQFWNDWSHVHMICYCEFAIVDAEIQLTRICHASS